LPAITADADLKKVPGLEDQDLRFLAIEGALAETKVSISEMKISMSASNVTIDEMKISMDAILAFLLRTTDKTVLEDSNSAGEDFIAPLHTSAPFVMPLDVSTSIIGNPVPIPFNVQSGNRRFHVDVPDVPSYHMAFQDNDRRKSAGDFFDKHLSTSSYMEAPMNAGYIRTLHAIDPHKSGVCLNHLDVANFFRWSQDLITLQKRQSHEDLQHCLFISRMTQFKINAWNEAKVFFGKPIMCGSTLSLDNKSLSIIISQMVMPETQVEWITIFKKLAVFPKLPNNQHTVVPDATRFDDWWSAIILYIFDANLINDFLKAVPSNVRPVMRTFNQKPGLMQIFYDQIPMNAGKNINNLIEYDDLKNCENLKDYTDLFLAKANEINESSKIAQINRQRLDSQSIFYTPIENIKNHSNKFNEKNKFNYNKNPSNNEIKSNIQNNNPYRNPYEKRLHSLQDNQVSVIDHYNSCDIDNDDEYDESSFQISHNAPSVHNEMLRDTDDSHNHDDCNDVNYDAYNNSDSFEGDNPGLNVTNNLSNINTTGAKLEPCFKKFEGKCTLSDSECKYSHSFKELERLWWDREKMNKSSYYNPANKKPSSSQPFLPAHPTVFIKKPPTTLRSIRPTEAQNCALNYHKFFPPGDSAGTFPHNTDV
jgi:hypothetical protein